MEKESKEINIKIEKFEKVKEFRDLNSLRLINKDNSTISLNEKFKDFQEIYTLIASYIKTNNKKWLFSKKDEVYYIFSQNRLATSTVSTGNIDEDILKIKKISEDFDFISPEYINFDIPDEKQLRELRNVNFLEDGYWYYKYNKNDGTIVYSYLDFAGLGTKKNKGIFNIESFIDSLDTRNQSLKVETKITKEFDKKIEENGIEISEFTDLSKFIETLTEIGVFNKVKVENLLEKMKKRLWWRFWGELNPPTPKELLDRYKATLLESKELKDFEVILNYNLLDTDIIKGEDSSRKFRNLVNLYKTYKKYISCIYIKDNTEDTVELIFDYSKIISSAEDRNELFDGIEILYKDNNLGIEKEKIYNNRNIIYYKNGDIEEIYNPKSDSKISIYYYKNGDYEKRNYLNGILEGESFYKFLNGDSETREYKNGILEGIVIVKKGEKAKQYFYNNGNMEEMPILKKYLSIDKERINTDDYQEDILLDPNVGHWDLKEQDKKELKEILGKNVYKRNPKDDVNQGGIVAIDFGTKSTVVVYQKDSENILPMRISGDKLNREIRNTDYENPTVIEFRDINKFLKDYNAKVGRPDTKWQDITVSHTAFGNLTEVSSEYFDSIISDIKQWTASKNQKIILVDRKGKEILLPPYLELKEKSKDYIDPVELYAYYIGSYINNMINGIYLEYYLSFPVTYEKAIRERILKSFEKGIQKSLPIEIQEDKDLMKKFRVRHGANEPAAFAVCALSKLEIEPKNEEDKIYYGVFDFGGGTTDFDFGIWKYSEEEDLYDYELEHFGAGGERYLGGENILKELAYKVFTDNSSNLRKSQIQYTRPEWCDEIIGEETLVSQTKQARQNSTKVAKELRGIWENITTERVDFISVNLFDSHGEVNAGFKLNVKEDDLKNLIKEKIEKGIKNFFIKMEDAFKGEDVKEINIFLAGNSCKHPFVEEIFNSYIEKKKDKFKINIYDTKMFEKLKDTKKTNPTAKTGVAFGLIYSRNSGRIKVTSRDEKANINNEVNFKFYVGNNRRNKFNCIISPNSNYDEYKFFGIVKSDIFELYYSTSPEAQTNEMKSSEAKIKRVNLKKDYDEEERYRIYLKADESDKLVYAIVKEEKDIETKKFVEEGEVTLN